MQSIDLPWLIWSDSDCKLTDLPYRMNSFKIMSLLLKMIRVAYIVVHEILFVCENMDILNECSVTAVNRMRWQSRKNNKTISGFHRNARTKRKAMKSIFKNNWISF